jgi:hypothetical protein
LETTKSKTHRLPSVVVLLSHIDERVLESAAASDLMHGIFAVSAADCAHTSVCPPGNASWWSFDQSGITGN